MLEFRDLSVGYYRDLLILRNVTLTAGPKAITAILGANGVGKSTLLKACFGFLRPQYGVIELDGIDLGRRQPHEMAELGISYVPQQTGVFGEMTVEENIQLGAWTFRKNRAQVARRLERNFDRFPVLRERRRDKAGRLSGGQQRMVQVARSLMINPRLLLVDEPTAGLAKLLAADVYAILARLRDEGLTILLVDQEIRRALRIADYVYVLDLGRVRTEGPPAEFTDLEKAFWI